MCHSKCRSIPEIIWLLPQTWHSLVRLVCEVGSNLHMIRTHNSDAGRGHGDVSGRPDIIRHEEQPLIAAYRWTAPNHSCLLYTSDAADDM
eukprot:10592444-Alexandrium_andersonii.AAC.1